MGFSIDPERAVGKQVRRIAAERLDDALDLLAAARGSDAAAAEAAVHDTRKRCKEVRGLARLVRPELGAQYAEFNASVRDAARQLSELRDAHVLAATLNTLAESAPGALGVGTPAQHDTVQIGSDPRIGQARALLAEARSQVDVWKIGNGFGSLAGGLRRTYRDGASAYAAAASDPSDTSVHEWRKAAKYLWYQVRLLEDAAPSVLGPLVDQLDALGEALGDDHDLAMLVARMEADPEHFGGAAGVARAVALARLRQDQLRHAAFRAGATIYAERPSDVVRRIERYWRITRRHGPERPVGGVAELTADDQPDEAKSPVPTGDSIERERKFVVTELPELPDRASRLQQGYLAIGDHVSVRVRRADPGGCTLTVKVGNGGGSRLELEWPIKPEQFAAAWPHTAGRRIDKHRYELPDGEHTIELDVFHGALDGLVVAEVEFHDEAAMAAYRPPSWFGLEVTDDPAYSNAALSLHGAPDQAPRPTA